jgi:hypothetical protein
MKLVGLLLSLGLVACLEEPAPVGGAAEVSAAAPSPVGVEEEGAVSAHRAGQSTAATEVRPRLKIGDIVWGTTQLCSGGECVTARKVDKAKIEQSLNSAKWYCCCAGTIEDSPAGCQCASKVNCDGCNC